MNSVLGMAPKTEDFLAEAATRDMFEIDSSNLALERADDATKAFAQQMVADHEKTTGGLTSIDRVGADDTHARAKQNRIVECADNSSRKERYAVKTPCPIDRCLPIHLSFSRSEPALGSLPGRFPFGFYHFGFGRTAPFDLLAPDPGQRIVAAHKMLNIADPVRDERASEALGSRRRLPESFVAWVRIDLSSALLQQRHDISRSSVDANEIAYEVTVLAFRSVVL